MPASPRRNISEIRPYKPGKPVQEVVRELGITGEVIKLASNENPLGPSPKALQAVLRAAPTVHIYPEDGAYYLTQALTRQHGISEDELVLGNGSVEVILLIAQAFVNPGESVVYSDGAFIMYKIATKIVDGRGLTVPLKGLTHDLEAMAGRIEQDTRVIYIANPNNPTGTMVTGEAFEKFLERVPSEVVVVVDEAYREYIDRSDYPDTLRYIREGRSVVVLRTFSKIHGLAGLRVGYGIGPASVIEAVRKCRLPFNVNSLAQEACLAALGDEQHIQRSRQVNREGLDWLNREIDRLGLRRTDSVANFIYIDVGKDAGPVFQALQHEGIIARTIKEYGFPNCLRVTVGTQQQNRRFVTALEKVLGGNAG
jgi:histidinol-phosphate aminotransferase